jgi:hypothetical protein
MAEYVPPLAMFNGPAKRDGWYSSAPFFPKVTFIVRFSFCSPLRQSARKADMRLGDVVSPRRLI